MISPQRIMISPQNIMRHEFIGLQLEVAYSSHEGLKGIKGKVVDETKNTIKIEDDEGKEKIIPKKVAIFHFTLPDGKIVEIEGEYYRCSP